MKKSDLQTGMIIELRNGERYLFIKNILTQYTEDTETGLDDVLINLSNNSWDDLEDYNENLECQDTSILFKDNWDIVKIYQLKHPTNVRHLMCDSKVSFEKVTTVLWEKEEYKEMTIAEIEAALGYKIKIKE